MSDLERQIAKIGLVIEALKLNPNNPFTWASGYRMPIYNDNRRFLFDSYDRGLVSEALLQSYRGMHIRERHLIIAGTSTAGIPWGTLLADRTGANFIYVRDKPKDHGLRNQIEGIGSESDLSGGRILLIEDLISTGGSSVKAVQTLRDAKGDCKDCLSIFNYGLPEAKRLFEDLTPPCNVNSVLTYETLIDVAKEERYITENEIRLLEEWRADPFGWGEKHGFPRIEKK